MLHCRIVLIPLVVLRTLGWASGHSHHLCINTTFTDTHLYTHNNTHTHIHTNTHTLTHVNTHTQLCLLTHTERHTHINSWRYNDNKQILGYWLTQLLTLLYCQTLKLFSEVRSTGASHRFNNQVHILCIIFKIIYLWLFQILD